MSNRDNGWIASISDLHFRKPRPAAPGNEWSAPDLRHGDHGYHRQPPRTGSAAPRPRSDRDRCASSIEQRPVRLHVDPDRLHEPRPRSAGSRFTWTSTATGARAAPRARHRTAPNQGVAKYHRQPPRPAERRHGRVRPRPMRIEHRAAPGSPPRRPGSSPRPRPRSAGSRFTWTSTATGARAAPRARHRTAPNQGSQVPPAAAATGRAALRPCSDRARCASSIERRPVRLHAARIASTPRPRPRPRAAPGS